MLVLPSSARLARLAAPLVLALAASTLLGQPAGSAAPGPAAGQDRQGRLERLAEANGLPVAEIRALLRDPLVRLTPQGDAYVVDPAAPAASARWGAAPARAVAPLTQTFRLHSNPRAQRTIYLDFDGTSVRGTAWNKQLGVRAGRHSGWDPANNGPGFNNREKKIIQSVWARVAEDYAPFAVDVTTEKPADARIHRSSRRDKVFGTRVLISESRNAHDRICDRQCGGVSFLNNFSAVGRAHKRKQPAWVFPAGLRNDTKAVAEAAAHEAGHTFGLLHDGQGGLLTSTEYYTGHKSWAPIMGAAYFRPITQWSHGSYDDATTHQDDVAVIARRGAPFRRDEAGGKPRTAARHLPDGTSYISKRNDVDVYRVGACSGRIVAKALGARISPNLDLRLRLLRNGRVVEVADPPSHRKNRDRATGMNAVIRHQARGGTYFVEVDGVGRGNPVTSYNDYGSLGAYRLTVTGC